MPKAAPAAAKEEKQVSDAQFFNSFNRKAAAAKASAKKQRPAGYMTDQEIIEKLGLGPNVSKTFPAKVSKIVKSFAKDDANRPMFRFVYVLVSDDPAANGMVLSNNHIIEDAANPDGTIWRTEQEAMDNFFFELQALGEDTEAYTNPAKDAMEAIARHTAEKTDVSIRLSTYEKKKDKSLGLNIRILGPDAPHDNSDLEQSESANSEPLVDGNEAAAEGQFNPDEWIDQWVSFPSEEYGDEEGLVYAKVVSYNAETDKFDLRQHDGSMWDGDFAQSVDNLTWQEDQNDESYA